jgi:hypothetical protein
MCTQWEEYIEYQKSLREEYALLGHQWRFLQGIRAAMIVALVSGQAAVSVPLRSTMQIVATQGRIMIDSFSLVILAFAGLMLTTWLTILEKLISTLLREKASRGQVVGNEIGCQFIQSGEDVLLTRLDTSVQVGTNVLFYFWVCICVFSEALAMHLFH